MKKRKFAKGSIQELAWEGAVEGLHLEFGGEWTQEGKYQYKELVVHAEDDDKYYRYWVSRSGSPFTDWTYGWEWGDDELELDEVHEVGER
jgi:hypothetical protein